MRPPKNETLEKSSGQRITVHQFHFNAAPGDAITNQLFFLREALKKVAITGEIFAQEIHPDVADRVLPLEERKLWDSDLILLHHSHGNRVLRRVLGVEVPKALVYHNITPESYLPHDPLQASLSRLGRAQLPLFKKCAAFFADSEFNLAELKNIGLKGGSVLPLFDLATKETDFGPKMKRKRSEPYRLLFVGRLTPHKNQTELLRTVFYLKRRGLPVKLSLVGRGHPLYVSYLHSLIRVWQLEDSVEITGALSDAKLRAVYRATDAFVSLSLHEGFCIPLVEAMRNRVPVFALSRTGASETLGSAGVQISTEEASEVAEILFQAVPNQELLETVLSGQDSRLLELSGIQNERRAQELCLNLVRKHRSAPHTPRAEKELDVSR